MDSSIPANKRDKRQIKHSLLLSRLKSHNPTSKRTRVARTSTSTAMFPTKPASMARKEGGRNRISKVANKNAMKHQRRKRARNLSANLADMLDALPAPETEGVMSRDGPGGKGAEMVHSTTISAASQANVVSRSRNITYRDSTMAPEGLKRKAGFQRRVGYLSAVERKRFGANLTAMSVPSGGSSHGANPEELEKGILENDRSEAENGSQIAEQGDAGLQRRRWAALRSQITQSIH